MQIHHHTMPRPIVTRQPRDIEITERLCSFFLYLCRSSHQKTHHKNRTENLPQLLPASGERYYIGGNLNNQNSQSEFWTSEAHSATGAGRVYFYADRMYTTATASVSLAYSLRCIKI